LEEAGAAGGVAPDGAQLVLGRDEGAEVAEELVHERLGGDRAAVVGPVGRGGDVPDRALLSVGQPDDDLVGLRRRVNDCAAAEAVEGGEGLIEHRHDPLLLHQRRQRDNGWP
jgi:hypothetical protein